VRHAVVSGECCGAFWGVCGYDGFITSCGMWVQRRPGWLPVFLHIGLFTSWSPNFEGEEVVRLWPVACGGPSRLSGGDGQLHVVGSGERDEGQGAVFVDLRSEHVFEVVGDGDAGCGGCGLYLFADFGGYACLKKHGGCIFLTTLTSGDRAHVPIVAFVCILVAD
jgi:hypothetical protein